ncbi:MAG TPA: hypothetical protein VMH23_08765 [Bacteroidota bacterium]|nr:hypothetical protein [Bacteroidota bacterium]
MKKRKNSGMFNRRERFLLGSVAQGNAGASEVPDSNAGHYSTR